MVPSFGNRTRRRGWQCFVLVLTPTNLGTSAGPFALERRYSQYAGSHSFFIYHGVVPNSNHASHTTTPVPIPILVLSQAALEWIYSLLIHLPKLSGSPLPTQTSQFQTGISSTPLSSFLESSPFFLYYAGFPNRIRGILV